MYDDSKKRHSSPQKLQVLIDNDNLDLYIDQYLNQLKQSNPKMK